MGIKLNAQKHAITAPQYRDLVRDAVDMHCALEAMHASAGEVDELEQVQANLDLCMSALTKADGTKMIQAIGAQESIAALCNVAEAKLTAKIAQEGLIESAKNVLKTIWRKIKEFFARICDVFRKIFSNAEGELKHLEKLVAAENDSKFNADRPIEGLMITKAGIDALLHAATTSAKMCNKVLPVFKKILADSEIKAAFKKIADSGLNITRPSDTQKADEVSMSESLRKKMDNLGAEFNKTAEEAAKIAAEDPVLKNIVETGDRLAKVGDKKPIDALKIINANYLKAGGTIADYGWKTGADLRGTIQEFVKNTREISPLMKECDVILKEMNDYTASLEKIATNAGIPKDFAELIGKCVRMCQNFVTLYNKNLHTGLIGVTRVVRSCYN